jgi:4-hydroxythreonine-4-phosphate dehydrogenase
MAPPPRHRPGQIRADAARAAYACILAATAAAQNRRLDAIVTAPISKEAFKLAGIREPGHTELLARLTGTRRYAMMLFGEKIRVVLVTRHLPLRKVADALTAAAIVEAVEMLALALPWMGFKRARIGVCGLNPHAGDGGTLGTEEKTVIAPALARCRKRGWNVTGPIPADAIFHQHLAGKFDAVVAMYHDQGLAPMKMLSFDSGVNLTLGLPIIRTSPDHGTAFDIAGKGIADPASTRAALDWAARLAARKNPWA